MKRRFNKQTDRHDLMDLLPKSFQSVVFSEMHSAQYSPPWDFLTLSVYLAVPTLQNTRS
uniref:Uncharacterized protein n=1 Tax=Anguilla anguilla TaxID=7936 RepID=A0A0E9X3G1_ANGAN